MKWRHLDSLQLANPEFDMPRNVDLLLGADIFRRVVFHGQRFGPSGSPSTFEIHFGWVLAGGIHIGHTLQGSTNVCYVSTITKEKKVDDLLRKFWEIEDHNIKQPACQLTNALWQNTLARHIVEISKEVCCSIADER